MSIAVIGAPPAAVARTTPATSPVPPPGAPSAPRATGVGTATTGSGAPSTARAAAAKAATQFERVLLEQLTKELAATAAPDEDEASAATSAYRDMLPATMADALSQAGGIGLAAQLTHATDAASAGTGTATATGTPS